MVSRILKQSPPIGRTVILTSLVSMLAIAAMIVAFLGQGTAGTAYAADQATLDQTVQDVGIAPLDTVPIGVTSDDGISQSAVTDGIDPVGQIAPAAIVDPTSPDKLGITDFSAIPIGGDGLAVLEITLIATLIIIGAILLSMAIAGFEYVRTRLRRRLDLTIASAIISGDGMMTRIQRLRTQGRVALASIVSVIHGWARSIFTRTEEKSQAQATRTSASA